MADSASSSIVTATTTITTPLKKNVLRINVTMVKSESSFYKQPIIIADDDHYYQQIVKVTKTREFNEHRIISSQKIENQNPQLEPKIVTKVTKTTHFNEPVVTPENEDLNFSHRIVRVTKKSHYDEPEPKIDDCSRIGEDRVTRVTKTTHFSEPMNHDYDDPTYDEPSPSHIEHESPLRRPVVQYGARPARNLPECVACGLNITAGCVTAMAPNSGMAQKFHPACFVCSYCLKALNQKGTYKEHQKKPYCHECFYRLYSGLIYSFDDKMRPL